MLVSFHVEEDALHADVVALVKSLVIGTEYDVCIGDDVFAAKLLGFFVDDTCKRSGGCYLTFSERSYSGAFKSLWSRDIQIAQRKS